MTLQYDIDIHYIMPEAVVSDPKHAEMMKLAGIELNSRGNYVAKFRDPRTAAALDGADPIIKEYFSACGFAFIPSGMRLPAGTFDAKFDDHLTDAAKRMQENITKLDPLKDAETPPNWNGFDISQLMVWIGTCQPVTTSATSQPMHPQKPANKKSASRLPSLVKVALLGLAGYAVYSVT